CADRARTPAAGSPARPGTMPRGKCYETSAYAKARRPAQGNFFSVPRLHFLCGVARPPLAGAALPLVGLWPGVARRQRTPALAHSVSELPRLVLRVAHLYGGRSLSPGRQNLADRFLRLARAGEPIAATRGQYLNPTYVGDVVAATVSLLEHKISGLLHLTGEGECTVAEFAQAVCQAAGLRGTIREVAADPRPAPRPRYTVLANLRLARLGFPPLPHWQVSLAQHICASGSAQS